MLNVFPAVQAEIIRLKGMFPSYKIKTTGHSAGAALAFLTQLELDFMGFPTSMINFGQPRVGDIAFVKWASNVVSGSIYRVVHAGDVVPHLPWSYLDYYQEPTEEFEDKNHNLKTCSATVGEDPECSA